MPRPKVPAHQRRRAEEACVTCRETKKRCSGSVPCLQCSRRGLERRCFISHAPRGSRTKTMTRSSRGSIRTSTSSWDPEASLDRHSLPGTESSQSEIASVADTTLRPASPRPQQPDGEAAEKEDASSSPSGPCMLWNSRGERVFIGRASSISFLQAIRGLVAQEIGPCPFSHNGYNDKMLEIDFPQNGQPVEPLSLSQKQDYLRHYLSVTEGLLLLFDSSELESLTLSPFDQSGALGNVLPPMKTASILLVMAIGAQAESPLSAKTVGTSCFREAQRLAFAGFLHDPDVDMVRAFLLMAYYMLGECRRNTAYMYLGIACRGALALGLHRRDSESETLDARDQLRLQVWMSVCIVDQLANSILGRSGMIGSVSGTDVKAMLSLGNSGNDAARYLVAAYEIVAIVSDIKDNIYEKKTITHSDVEQLLQSIEQWKQSLLKSLPGFTSANNLDTTGPATNRGAVAKIHLGCLYYWAVTLVTRPFLISAIIAKPPRPVSRSHIATACLDAAVYLCQTCAEARDASILPRSMCMLKALVFAAGLVLGVHIFSSPSVKGEIRSAYHDAKEILVYFSGQSPQAGHYADILKSLSNAISQRYSGDSSPNTSRYVSKIFNLQPSPPPLTNDNMSDNNWLQLNQDSQIELIPLDAESLDWSFATLEGYDINPDWGSLDVSQWDNPSTLT